MCVTYRDWSFCNLHRRCGCCAPEHGTPISINGGDLSIVAGVDGAECGVQRVAGAASCELDICTCRGAMR